MVDTVQNLKALLSVARTGSFSAAAREAGLATSVLTKRIDQLEDATRTKLFIRTTRKVTLTDAGRRWLTKVKRIVSDLDVLMTEAANTDDDLAGVFRIKVPTSLAGLYIGDMLVQFMSRYQRVSLDVTLTDRVVNPAVEGFDLAVSVFGASFSGVVDIPLCPLQRTLCATPQYLSLKGVPEHPRDLVSHDLLNFRPTGDVWIFGSRQGAISIDVQPRLSANDGRVLLSGALAGQGIALMSNYIAASAIRSGALLPVLDKFPLPEIWVKILVPESRMQNKAIQALSEYLVANFNPPPWDS